MKAHGAFREEDATVSINATHFARKKDAAQAAWRILNPLGVSGSSLVLGSPGHMDSTSDSNHLANAPWVEYDFNTASQGNAALTIHLLPVFPVDSTHQLRFAVEVDGHAPQRLDLGGVGEWHENSAPTWATNVLDNDAQLMLPLGKVPPGPHTLRLLYVDPGVIFQHLTITFPGAPSAYPVPPETRCKR